MGSSVTGVVDTPKNYIEGYGYHHVALLRDLSPGATYQYTVSCNGHTATRSFEVAPDGLTSYTALVLADMGYGSKGNAEQSRRMMEELKGPTRITIHAGDVGYADDAFYHKLDPCNGEFCYEAVYDKYMGWIENVTESKPYMVGPGNHEAECHSPNCIADAGHKEALRNFSAFNTRWAMPAPESKGTLNMWYSFDYGSVHYVSANTETDFDSAPEESTDLWDYYVMGSDYEIATLEVTPSKLVWKAYNSRTGEIFDTFDIPVRTEAVVV